MISPLYAGSTSEKAAAPPVTEATKKALGQDAFLKMFMAQVTNQNPLDPMDNTEYTAQLATFSSLEQLTKIAKSMETMDSLKQTMEQTTILSYLGKEVTLAGDMLPVSQGHVGAVGYTLKKDAEVMVVVTDESGSKVAEIPLGRQQAGAQEFQWDGKTTYGQAVPDGVYKITISATDSRGNPVEVSDQTVTGLVTGYQKGADGTSYLLLGEAALPLKDVLAVRQPPAPQQAQSQVSEFTPANAAVPTNRSASADSGGEASDTGSILKSLISLGGLAAALL